MPPRLFQLIARMALAGNYARGKGGSVADLGHISCVGLYAKSINGLHMIFSGGCVDAAGMGTVGELFLPNGLARLMWPRPN